MDPELNELVRAWVGAAVADHRRDALLQRLRADAPFRLAFVEEIRLLGMLKVVRSAPPRWLRLEDLFGWSADENRDAPRALAGAVAARIRDLPLPADPPARRPWSLVAIVLLGAVAVVLPHGPPRPDRPPVSEAVAVAVRLADAEWAGRGPSEGEGVGSGPLVLRKGRATLTFRTGATAHVEGPADIDVVSASRMVCHRGRFRIEVPPGATAFTVAAPGTSVVGADVDYELSVAEDRAEVTVRGGRPVVSALGSEQRTMKAGEFLRIDSRPRRILAGPRTDSLQPPPNTPVLTLAPGYAQAILADRPAGYWRFESVTGGVCPNEIVGGPGLRLIGLPTLHGAPGGENRSLYFSPSTLGGPHGALSDGVWKPAGKEFAIECWVLPRVAAQAAVLGVLADTAHPQLNAHVAYVELTGATAPAPNTQRRVRGLYRFPASTECFSESAYRPLQWLHVVAQRTGDQFELYTNGEMTAKGPLEAKLALPSSRLLIGALYASRDGKSCTGRPFAGLIDEVAVYDHPLARADVLRHYRLGAPRK